MVSPSRPRRGVPRRVVSGGGFRVRKSIRLILSKYAQQYCFLRLVSCNTRII